MRTEITENVASVKTGLANLKAQLQDLIGGDHIPDEEESNGALPNPQDIIALFPPEKY